jgi:two-component system phosphate regulon sensor histidine kinase PhoR
MNSTFDARSVSASKSNAEFGNSTEITNLPAVHLFPTFALATDTTGMQKLETRPQVSMGLRVKIVRGIKSLLIRAFSASPVERRRAPVGEKQAPVPQNVSALHLAAAISDPIVFFDGGGAIVHVNAAAADAFGPLRLGSPVRLTFRTPEMQELISRAVETGAGGDGVDFAERIPVERLFRVTAAPLGTARGLFVLVFKDQSEARRIDRMRADFIANASHELRTPLASISGFIETLRGPARNDAKARAHFLEIMETQTRRMARLIDDLLSLSRLEMKAFSRPGGMVDIAAVLEGVVDALKPLAGELDVVLEKETEAGSLTVRGDRDELFQVFANLVENACKYGQTGKRVVVSAVRRQEGVVAAVRDFGPGIPKEHIPRITERFYRVDVENSRSRNGTGLGLAIVKHIVTRHNARLDVWSEPGEGACFSVHFPPD